MYPLQIQGRIFQPEKYATILSYIWEVEYAFGACFLDLAKFLSFPQICEIYFFPYNLKRIQKSMIEKNPQRNIRLY